MFNKLSFNTILSQSGREIPDYLSHDQIFIMCFNVDGVENATNDGLPSIVFDVNMLSCIENENNFLNCIIVSDDATVHLINVGHKNNCKMRYSENPQVVQEGEKSKSKYESVLCSFV